MSTSLSASLLSWSDVPPQTPACFQEGASATDNLSLEFIPMALRRRCSPFSKVTLAVANAAAAAHPRRSSLATVFASAHGESGITASLLREIAESLPVSPMGFSLSVHNAASGLYSISTDNKAPSTALGAGENTFLMGLCEALLLTRDAASPEVLYVCSDDPIPDVFLPKGAARGSPHAIALLLSATECEPNAPRLTISITPRADATINDEQPQSTAFATWLRESTSPLALHDTASRWEFSASMPTSSVYRSPCRSQ